MNKLLYYPHFEIQDENFLKFALLYVDEIRPIIPQTAMNTLSDTMNMMMNNTELINPYKPDYKDGDLASIMAIEYLEKSRDKKNLKNKNACKLYREKYSYRFEQYCLENNLCETCDDGIMLSEDIAYTYMSILADVISKETETDMITDSEKYCASDLKYKYDVSKENMEKMKRVQKEIEFYVPSDMNKILIEEFINLRSNCSFEKARKNFVNEFNIILNLYDKNLEKVDLYNLMECKKEITGLVKKLCASGAAITVGVKLINNISRAEREIINFWGDVGNICLNLDTLKQNYHAVREYADRIEQKKQARRYLTKIRQLQAEI